MSLFERFGQADIEEIAVERLAPNLAALDQRREHILLERAGQGGNEVEDLALEHIDPAIDDSRARPARVLFQKRDDFALLLDHPPVARGVGNRAQRQGRHRAALKRGLLQRAQIDVEKRVPVHHQEPGIERFARDRERARGAERRLFAQHP